MSSEQESIIHQTIKDLICPSEGFIHIATNNDAETLFHFINKAYKENHDPTARGNLQNRLNRIEEIHNFMENGIFLLLTASAHEQTTILDDQCSIVACVYILHLATDKTTTTQINDTKSSTRINLLTVHPKMVRRGIARYMIQVVEAVAKKLGYTHIWLRVLSTHKHLLDMYTKWSFNIIGTKTLIEADVDPKKFSDSCYFILFEKKL